MSLAKKFGNLEKQLQKLNMTLDRLIEDVVAIKQSSAKIDYDDAINHLKKHGELRLSGTSPFYFTIMQYDSKNYKNIINILSDSDIFNVIALPNYNEDFITNKRIINVLEYELKKYGESIIPVIINLRFSPYPPFYDDNVIFIGKRYYYDSKGILEKMTEYFNKRGFNVIYDVKDFGGGPFVYQVIDNMSPAPRLSIFEITVSENLINKLDLIETIFNIFVTIM